MPINSKKTEKMWRSSNTETKEMTVLEIDRVLHQFINDLETQGYEKILAI